MRTKTIEIPDETTGLDYICTQAGEHDNLCDICMFSYPECNPTIIILGYEPTEDNVHTCSQFSEVAYRSPEEVKP